MFDHSPRSKNRGVIFADSSPKKWKKLLDEIFEMNAHKDADDNLILIKAWNEWGEGNYMEPDLQYGHGYINALKEAIDETRK
jgi:hypothetical protein